MDRGKPSTTAERASELAERIARKALIFTILAVIFGFIGLLHWNRTFARSPKGRVVQNGEILVYPQELRSAKPFSRHASLHEPYSS
jgi:hypothetical protein